MTTPKCKGGWEMQSRCVLDYTSVFIKDREDGFQWVSISIFHKVN